MDQTNKTEFDRLTRIPASQVDPQSVGNWLPPIIDHDGHIVQAVGKSWSRSPATAGAKAAEAQSGIDDFESDEVLLGREFEKAKNAGFEEGRKEGFEAGKKKGFESGEEAGRAEGLASAKQEYRIETEGKLTDINRLLTHLSHCLNEQDYNLEQALFNSVKVLAKAVLRKELALDPKHIMAAVSDIIKSLPPSRDNIKIYCSTTDKALIAEAVAYGGENWSVFEAFDVESGGCRVVTDQSVIDYTVSQRFEEAVAKMLESRSLINEADMESFEQAVDPVVQNSVRSQPQVEAVRGLADEAEDIANGNTQSPQSESNEPQGRPSSDKADAAPLSTDDNPVDDQ